MSVMLEHLKPVSDLFPANNHAHIILRLFDCWAKFPFTTSEKEAWLLVIDWYISVVLRVAEKLKT